MSIAFNSPDGICRVGSSIVFSGYVDDFETGISAMGFSLDNGETWTSFPTTGAVTEKGVHWSFTYTPEQAGTYVLKARAVDKAGAPSPLVASFTFEVLSAVPPGETDAFGSFHMRAIDGGPLQGARLFRSNELAAITPEEARVVTHELGIQTIYDLRNDSETAASPSPYLVGTQQVAVVPNVEHRRKDAAKRLVAGVIGRYGAPGERMLSNYRRYVDECPTLSAALRSIAANGTPTLIHCVNGKDRTGVLSAVIERIAGHHEDDIMEHYLLANVLNAANIAAEEAQLSVGMTDEEHAMLMSFLEARPEYLRAFFTEIDARYGDFNAYVGNALHLGAVQRDALIALMTRKV